jgi:hypothetical protein
VTDPSGAAVANARVTLSNPEHGINRETDTNGDGQYLVSGVPPGLYKLTIAAPGFKKYEAAGLILRVAQKARADAELQVGAATSEVTVEGTPVRGGTDMKCVQASEITAYLQGEGSKEDRAMLRSHYEQCDSCARELAQMERTFGALGRLQTIEPSADFKRRTEEAFLRAHPGFRLHYFGWKQRLLMNL